MDRGLISGIIGEKTLFGVFYKIGVFYTTRNELKKSPLPTGLIDGSHPY
jgi:hypothetical protein